MMIWASVSKIIDTTNFMVAVQGYDMLPLWAVPSFAVILPWTEFFVGICLISGFALRGAWLITALLFVSFTISHAFVLARGLDVPCGCGFRPEDKVTPFILARSAAFLAMATFAWFMHTRIRTFRDGACRDRERSSP